MGIVALLMAPRWLGARISRAVARVFLEEVLRLRANAAKSAVGRPWGRKLLGLSLRIAPESVRREAERVRERLRSERGHALWRL